MKSTCDWEALEALVLGELAPDEGRAARAHAAGCAECARELRLLERDRRAIEALARADVCAAPVAAVDGVMARVERRRGARMRRATWAAAAAAAALLLVRVHLVSASSAADGSPGDGAGVTCVRSSDTTPADDRAVLAADEAWGACMTMTPTTSPPAPMSFDDARVTGAVFSALPLEACQ